MVLLTSVERKPYRGGAPRQEAELTHLARAASRTELRQHIGHNRTRWPPPPLDLLESRRISLGTQPNGKHRARKFFHMDKLMPYGCITEAIGLVSQTPPKADSEKGVEIRVYLAESPSAGSSMGPREKLNGEAPHGALQPRVGGSGGFRVVWNQARLPREEHRALGTAVRRRRAVFSAV